METFLLSFFISAAGSLQAGPVNLSVASAALYQSRRAALWMALGGCLPEMGYAALALQGANWLPIYPRAVFFLEVGLVVALVGLGVQAIVAKPKEAAATPASSLPFWKGFGLASLNPQLLLFWLAVLVYLRHRTPMAVGTPLEQILFVAGTALGAFALLAGLAYGVSRYKNVLPLPARQQVSRAIGWVFIGLGLLQVLRLWLH